MKKLILATALTAISLNVSAAWRNTEDVDPMTGAEKYWAMSDWTKSLKPMGFPYQNTESLVGIGCNKQTKNVWTYFAFTKAPNMTNGDTKDGYNVHTRRVKFDDLLTKLRFTQDWGGKSLNVSDYVYSDEYFIKNLKSSNKITLDMSDWSGANNPYFVYSLAGSTKAINTALSKCGIEQPKSENKLITTVVCDSEKGTVTREYYSDEMKVFRGGKEISSMPIKYDGEVFTRELTPSLILKDKVENGVFMVKSSFGNEFKKSNDCKIKK